MRRKFPRDSYSSLNIIKMVARFLVFATAILTVTCRTAEEKEVMLKGIRMKTTCARQFLVSVGLQA